MEQILLVYGLPKETVAAIMMLYKNTKVKVHSSDGDTDFFDIPARSSTRWYFSPISFYNLPRPRTSNIDWFNERKWLYTEKARSRWYPTQTITDADYADDIALQANTPATAESLQHRLEKTEGSTGLHVNVDKIEYMCFNQNQTRHISILTGSSLKLEDTFIYLGSSVSSTENHINTKLAWSAIDRLSVIWKSDLFDKIKHNFFQAVVVSIQLYGCTTWMLTKHMEKKLDSNCTTMLWAILNKTTIQIRWTRYARHCKRSKD